MEFPFQCNFRWRISFIFFACNFTSNAVALCLDREGVQFSGNAFSSARICEVITGISFESIIVPIRFSQNSETPPEFNATIYLPKKAASIITKGKGSERELRKKRSAQFKME